MNKLQLFTTASALIALAASSANAATVTVANGDFSSSLGATNGAFSTPLTGNFYQNQEIATVSGGQVVWSNDNARAVSQAIVDAKANSGLHNFNFTLSATSPLNGTTDNDFYVYVLGWNTGDTAPLVDHRIGQSSVGTTATVNPGAAVSLFSTAGARLDILTDGAAAADASGFDGTSTNFSFETNLLGGYDNIAIIFDVAGGLSSGYALDNVSFTEATAVPEPSSTALLGLGGLALILRRRRA